MLTTVSECRSTFTNWAARSTTLQRRSKPSSRFPTRQWQHSAGSPNSSCLWTFPKCETHHAEDDESAIILGLFEKSTKDKEFDIFDTPTKHRLLLIHLDRLVPVCSSEMKEPGVLDVHELSPPSSRLGCPSPFQSTHSAAFDVSLSSPDSIT